MFFKLFLHYNIKYNVNSMQIVAILYCIRDNGKKYLYLFSTDPRF